MHGNSSRANQAKWASRQLPVGVQIVICPPAIAHFRPQEDCASHSAVQAGSLHATMLAASPIMQSRCTDHASCHLTSQMSRCRAPRALLSRQGLIKHRQSAADKPARTTRTIMASASLRNVLPRFGGCCCCMSRTHCQTALHIQSQTLMRSTFRCVDHVERRHASIGSAAGRLIMRHSCVATQHAWSMFATQTCATPRARSKPDQWSIFTHDGAI